jgi:CHAD domain-containing protein
MIRAHKETLEREIKLGVDRGFALPRLGGKALPPRVLTSIYYDTDNYRLAQAHITLRYRIEAAKGSWQLKLPRDSARLELEFSGDRRGPPESLRTLLFAHLRGHPLRPIATLRTRRTGTRIGGTRRPLADVVLDSVDSLEGRRVVDRLHELEVERLAGDEKDLRRIEQVLRAAGAVDGDPRPKVFQLLGLGSTAAPDPVPPLAQPIEHIKAALRTHVQLLLTHDPGTRLGSDPEELHKMRVATRRLRAYLRAAHSLFVPEWVAQIRTETAWLGSALGPVRDLDVLLAHLREACATLRPSERRACERLLERLEAERTAARAALLQTLESDRYLLLLERLETAAQEPVVSDTIVSLMDIAGAEFKKLRRAVKVSGFDASDAKLHEIRIKGKRARYAAELAQTSVGKPAARFLLHAKAFQDLLGEHHDAAVTEQRLRTLIRSARNGMAAVALGRLIERQFERRRRVRKALPTVWRKLKKQGEATWHRSMESSGTGPEEGARGSDRS